MGTISLVIPQIGQPDTTEDVKVQNAFTTIQTVINGNLDTSNLNASAAISRSQMAGGLGGLAWTSVSTNTSATDGHFYEVTATATITLPTPTTNVTVGVFCAAASGTVTVTAGSGVIMGSGMSGAASFSLGLQGAYAVLIANGTNWRIVAGQQDTGWTALSFPGGVSSTGNSYPGAARLQGNMVQLRGQLGNAGTITGGSALFTVPSNMKPTGGVGVQLATFVQGGMNAMGISSSTGNATIGTNWTNTFTCELNGLSYSVA